MAQIKTVSEQATDSIEVSKNAKGEYSYTIKVYFTDDPKEAEERIEKIHQWFVEFKNKTVQG